MFLAPAVAAYPYSDSMTRPALDTLGPDGSLDGETVEPAGTRGGRHIDSKICQGVRQGVSESAAQPIINRIDDSSPFLIVGTLMTV